MSLVTTTILGSNMSLLIGPVRCSCTCQHFADGAHGVGCEHLGLLRGDIDAEFHHGFYGRRVDLVGHCDWPDLSLALNFFRSSKVSRTMSCQIGSETIAVPTTVSFPEASVPQTRHR